MLSSQNELNKLYIKTKKSDLDARDTKIASTIEQLEKETGNQRVPCNIC